VKQKTVIVDDKEVDAAKFLAALHNNTRALGLGKLQDIKRPLTQAEAAADLAEMDGFNFDYYRGRPLKTGCGHEPNVILTETSRRLYDRDAGDGQFDKAIAEALR
jgi:hypothetical protein